MKHLKNIGFLSLLFSAISLATPFTNTWANSCNCADLQNRIERLERAVFSGTGTVKTKSLNNQESSSNSNSGSDSTGSSGTEPSLSPADKEKLMKELEQLKRSQEESQKYLDTLMKEN